MYALRLLTDPVRGLSFYGMELSAKCLFRKSPKYHREQSGRKEKPADAEDHGHDRDEK